MGIFPDIFTEMAVLLLLAAVAGALSMRLRQPLIVARLQKAGADLVMIPHEDAAREAAERILQ
jgi:anti-sigma-K factor RskA